MIIKDFIYCKDEIEKKKKVWIFNEDEKYISGIEIGILILEEEKELEGLLKDKILVEKEEDNDFKIAMKPYMKAWRKFLKEKIIVKEEKEIENEISGRV